MPQPVHFYIVDDDPMILEMEEILLVGAGYQVSKSTSSVQAMGEIILKRPDVVIVDMMMPELDGLELCKRIREIGDLKNTKIIVVSAKAYEFDKRRAFQLGANSYITKPINSETFIAQIEEVVSDRVTLKFWGVHGTLPVPGKKTLRYGGNTSCVTLSLVNEQFFIFDAGSGIKELSNYMMSQGNKQKVTKIFISHPHWDHINALPFYVPLYIPGSEFEICGSKHGDLTMRHLIGSQMDGIYFPITMKEFGARVYFRDLKEEKITIAGITVQTMLLNHPGNCLGYRVGYKDKSVCYVTDNELYLPENPLYNEAYVNKLSDFVRGTDILITDTTYTDEEYRAKVGWGHSCVSRVADLAHRGEVKSLHLFHHDPDQSDDAIDGKIEQVRAKLAELGSGTKCLAPAEGDTFII
ncbi:MAG: response regulator [Desulfobacterales bacterium]|nr:response regulator [Desulfobacterales bacterium]